MTFETQEEAVEYGIAALQEFGEGLIETADLGADVLEDGKVSIDDIPQLLRVQTVWTKLKNAPQAVKELLNINEEKYDTLRANLESYAAERRGDLGSDTVEEIVKNVVLAAGALVKAINLFIK